MRYIKYSEIITLGLFSLTLSFIQCSRETDFQPFQLIKGQVTAGGAPVDSATIRIWIDGFKSDTLTYFTDSEGNFSTERINNCFDKNLMIEASRTYTTSSSTEKYGPVPRFVGPDGQNADSITTDAIYVSPDLKPAYGSYHFVTPKKLDLLNDQYISYFFIINDIFGKLLKWEIGENNTEWMSIVPIRIFNTLPTDMHTLKLGGYVAFQVKIKILPSGTYDSSILVITDQGNTLIPVHKVVK